MIKCVLDIKSGKPEPWARIQTASYTLLDAPVEFQEEGHIYTYNGQRLPSVTGILKAENFIDTTWYDDWSRDRGSYVHDATYFDDLNDLDEDTVDLEIIPRVEAWRKFKLESGFVIEQCEIPMMSKDYLFAGKPDRTGYFPTGNLKRAAVELRADGTYKLYPYTDRQDIEIWKSVLACFFWKLNNLKRKE
jgi:hypothetical protein